MCTPALIITGVLIALGSVFYAAHKGNDMETIGKAVNAVKDGYLWVADFVAAHPHWTIVAWLASLGASVRWL